MRHTVRRHSRPTKKQQATTASAAKLRQRKKEIETETETEKRRNEDETQPSRNNNKPLSTVWHTLSRVTAAAATAVVVAEGLCCVWCGVITQSVCLSVRLSNSLACFLHVFMLPNIESGTGISNFPSSSVCVCLPHADISMPEHTSTAIKQPRELHQLQQLMEMETQEPKQRATDVWWMNEMVMVGR